MSKSSRKTIRSPLAQWIYSTVWRQGLRVKYQVRGNTVHILCEGISCPDRAAILTRLILTLQTTDLNRLIPDDHPRIYQVMAYGRRVGQDVSGWAHTIYLNQIDRHIEQLRHLQPSEAQPTAKPSTLKQSATQTATEPTPTAAPRSNVGSTRSTTSTVEQPLTGSELLVPNRTLARRGNPDDIARYLSETLNRLGISVRVSASPLPYVPQETPSVITPDPYGKPTRGAQRLGITCEAMYSPDPMLIGEPIAQQLRELELENFQDAIVRIHVQGEDRPDWSLRVDLTPASEMLREWARWGDVEAIAYLIRQALTSSTLALSTASLQNSTLHLFFSSVTATVAPDQDTVKALIVPLLELLGPQGIHAATFYGQVEGQETPSWVEWLDLPAIKHGALLESPMRLAEQGDWGAIAFLLSRLLNPDLEKYLATGGIRTQILPKDTVLHIMNDAPIPPHQSQVGSTVAQFFKQLQLPGVTGVRVYGRRSGQRRPLWSYGKDFVARRRFVPEATPEFAATDAFVGELIAPIDENIFRPDLTADDLRSAWNRLRETALHRLQQALLASQVLMPAASESDLPSLPAAHGQNQGAAIAVVWGVVGLLLTVQLDWGLQRIVQAIPDPISFATASFMTDEAIASTPEPDALTIEQVAPTIELQQSVQDDDAFDSSVFTDADTPAPSATIEPAPLPPIDLPYTPPSPAGQAIANAVLANEPDFSTFNSRQIDEKIQLYLNYVEQYGAPDVLIIGSSRALRGVDPVALQTALSELGYDDVSVFNFGLNGATAQVVNLVLQHFIPPDQLPKLMIWADGARAFNSGAVDITFNGVTASQGYQELASGQIPALTASDVQPANTNTPGSTSLSGGIGASLTQSYQQIDRWLSDRLAHVSSVHDDRDQLKQVLQHWLTQVVPESPTSVLAPNPSATGTEGDSPSLLVAGRDVMDVNGFLSLAVRFNPATYYQQYARVPGAYDSDYESFRINGIQSEALQSVLQFNRSHQVPVVFVNLPLTDDYLDATRRQHEQTFREYMTRLSLEQSTEFVFRDLGEAWPTGYDYFSDPSHLNRYGAYQVAQRLAQDPMIPWAQVNAN